MKNIVLSGLLAVGMMAHASLLPEFVDEVDVRIANYQRRAQLLNDLSNDPHEITTSLHVALAQKDAQAALVLSKEKEHLNHIHAVTGRTALHTAYFLEIFDVFSELVLAGADVTLLDHNGMAVIHSVARDGMKDLLKLLLEYKPNGSLVSGNGKLPEEFILEALASEKDPEKESCYRECLALLTSVKKD